MANYSDLDLGTLMDLLIKHTEEYTKMVTCRVFSVEEFTQCKQKLAEIHSAIKEKSESDGHPVNNIFQNYPEDFSRRQAS